MLPKRIILVRHGESLGNANKDVYKDVPDHALPLTNLGQTQALAAGKRLHAIIGDTETIHFWVSPYKRTRETFMGCSRIFKPEQIVKAYESWGLREQDWGNFREKAATDILDAERDKYGATFYRFPNGESVADVWDRMGQFIETLWRDFHNPNYNVDNVVLVTHGRTMRVFLSRWYHYSVEYNEEIANPSNCEVWTMLRNKERFGHDRFELCNVPKMHRQVPMRTDLMSLIKPPQLPESLRPI